MKEIIFTKMCWDCDVEMQYLQLNLDQEEWEPTKVDLDMIWGKDFECPKCWKSYYMSDDIEWFIEEPKN